MIRYFFHVKILQFSISISAMLRNIEIWRYFNIILYVTFRVPRAQASIASEVLRLLSNCSEVYGKLPCLLIPPSYGSIALCSSFLDGPLARISQPQVTLLTSTPNPISHPLHCYVRDMCGQSELVRLFNASAAARPRPPPPPAKAKTYIWLLHPRNKAFEWSKMTNRRTRKLFWKRTLLSLSLGRLLESPCRRALFRVVSALLAKQVSCHVTDG